MLVMTSVNLIEIVAMFTTTTLTPIVVAAIPAAEVVVLHVAEVVAADGVVEAPGIVIDPILSPKL